MTGGERRRKWIRGCPAQRGGMHGPAAAGWIRRLGVEMGPGEPADTSGMKDETRSRRRCTECRRWYEPAASGVHNQKICGTASCRRGRRSRMARRRRARDIREYRVDERERQARRRAKRPTTASSTQVSRAGLPAQVAVLEQVVLEKWDRLMRVSRAGLRREIRVALGNVAQSVGQIPAGP